MSATNLFFAFLCVFIGLQSCTQKLNTEDVVNAILSTEYRNNHQEEYQLLFDVNTREPNWWINDKDGQELFNTLVKNSKLDTSILRELVIDFLSEGQNKNIDIEKINSINKIEIINSEFPSRLPRVSTSNTYYIMFSSIGVSKSGKYILIRKHLARSSLSSQGAIYILEKKKDSIIILNRIVSSIS